MLSHPGLDLSIQSTTVSSIHSTHGVYGSGQGGQSDGFKQAYKYPLVPRQLVGQSHIPPDLSPAYTNSRSNLSGVRLVREHKEIRTLPQTGLPLCSLPV